MRTLVAAVLTFLVTAGSAFCQQHDTHKKQFNSVFSEEDIVVDGQLLENVWKNLPVATDFTQTNPQSGQPARYKTVVRSIYNRRGIYFSFVSYDDVGANKYKAPDLKRDFDFSNHDMVGLAIDGFNDERNSMTFFVNAYGAQRDYQAYDDTYFDVDWNGLWKVKTTRTDSCWFAEFEIPWKTLRYKHFDNEAPSFRINFQRVERNINERSAWSPFPRSVGFNRMEYAGILSGFVPPPQTTNFQLSPYVFSSRGSNEDVKMKIGGELKWGITPNLIVDGTVNTDFAQADVDQQVNNLTRFSVLFPEKRQFFLESASLFGAGIMGEAGSYDGSISLIPFFSRRIGLDSGNSPVPINFGSRAVYRSNKRNIGIMHVEEGHSESADRTDYFIGRYSENLGKSARLGAIGTSKLAGGNVSNTAAVDGFFRIKNKHLINTILSLTTKNGTNGGLAGYVQYRYISDRFSGWLISTYVDENYEPETGFVSRKNVLGTMAGMELNLRGSGLPFRKRLRDFSPRVSADIYHQPSSGQLVEQTITVSPVVLKYKTGGQSGLRYILDYQNIISVFQPLGISIPANQYRYSRLEIFHSSNLSRKFSYQLEYGGGGYYDGQLQNLFAQLNYSPVAFASFAIKADHNSFRNVGEAKQDLDVILYSAETRFALNPQVQLGMFFQKNTLNDSKSLNARFSWEYRPLSFIYIVFNRNESGNMATPASNTGIIKINFLKQF